MTVEESGATVSEPSWFKSSYSTGSGGECVEVAASPAAVYVRDSKDREGPILAFDAAAWSAFVQFAAGWQS